MSRDLKDFVSTFLGTRRMLAEEKRAEAMDRWYGARAGNTPSNSGAWTQAHEDAYKQHYGAASGIPVTASQNTSGGLVGWLGRQFSGSSTSSAASSAPPPPVNYGGAGAGGSGYGSGDQYADATPQDTTVAENTAARGGVIRAIPGYAGGGQVDDRAAQDARIQENIARYSKPDDRVVNSHLRAINDYLAPPGPREGTNAYAEGGVAQPPVMDPDQTGHAVAPEPPPMLYGEDGHPTGVHMPATGQERTAAYDPDTEGPPAGTPASASAPAPTAIPASSQARAPINRNAGGDGLNAGDSASGSTNDVKRDVLAQALDGGIKYGIHTFHLDGDGVAVGTDPHQAGGQQAIMKGVGAADPQTVQDINKIVAETSADKQALAGPLGASILGMRRLEIVYQHFVQTGQTDKANKAAFELIQYGAGESAKLGATALQQLRSGDTNGAINNIVKALDEVLDGKKVTIGPDGKTAVWTDIRTGKVVGEYKFAPKDLFNISLGLSNRSTYWDLIMQRAQMTPGMQKDAKAARDDAVAASRIELNKARVAKLKGSGGGGGAAAVSPLADELAKIKAQGVPRPAATTQPAAPVTQGDGGETPAARDPAMDDAEHGLDAPADLKDNVNQSLPPGKTAPPPVTGSAVATPPATPQAPQEEKLEGVPDIVWHNGEPVQMQPGEAPKFTPPKFDEPNPKAAYGGQNPYTDMLSNPKYSAWFATKQGKAEKAGIAHEEAQLNRDYADWDKRRKEFHGNAQKEYKDQVTAFKSAHAEDIAKRREEAKSVYKKDIDPVAANRLMEERINPDVETLGKTDGSPIKDGVLKPYEASKMALDIIGHNRNMPVGYAVNAIDELTRSGDPGKPGEDVKWRSFTSPGKDLAGNVIVQMNGDKSKEFHLDPDTYKKINSVVEKRFKKKEAAAKNPPDSASYDTFKKYERKAMDIAGGITNYVRPPFLDNLNKPNISVINGAGPADQQPAHNSIYHDAGTVYDKTKKLAIDYLKGPAPDAPSQRSIGRPAAIIMRNR